MTVRWIVAEEKTMNRGLFRGQRPSASGTKSGEYSKNQMDTIRIVTVGDLKVRGMISAFLQESHRFEGGRRYIHR